ncbi:MAG: hypothetical protein IJU99_02470 [Lachnospiraceae bacterium]|nr:hypothetical protein [Lachnospiraceae bacterium]MBR0153666.1 hypothetical protein [Lachnospiraceae bacterium]
MFYALIALRVIFYLLLLYTALRYREERPYVLPLAGALLLFAWEIPAAVNNSFYWGNTLCLVFEAALFVWNLLGVLKKPLHRILYTAAAGAMTAFFFLAFTWTDGQLITSFAVMLVLAVEYVLAVRHISPRLRFPLAALRIAADLVAGFAYWKDYPVARWACILEAVINLIYISFSLEDSAERSAQKKGPKARRKQHR